MDEPVAEDRKTKRLRLAKWAGMAVMVFSVVGFVKSVAFAFLIDAFTVDIGTIIYFFVGLHTMKGGRLAAKWALGITVFYVLIGATLVVALQIAPDRLKISGKAIPAELLPYLTISMVVDWLWCVLNAVLLVRFLSFSRRKRIVQSEPAETH